MLRACADPADQAVLAHCASQSRALSLEMLRAQTDPERFSLAAEFLVARAELDPELEHLPPREHARARGWTRPELAVLLGYTKRLCKQALAAGGTPAHPSLAEPFKGYFPALLRDRFPHELETHQLRDAITATRVVNHVVDRAGASLVPELVRGLGAEVPEVLYAWLSADRLLGAETLRESATGDTEAARLRARVAVESAVAQAAASALGLEGRALLEPDEEAKRAAQIAELRELLGTGADALPALVRAPRAARRRAQRRTARARARAGAARRAPASIGCSTGWPRPSSATAGAGSRRRHFRSRCAGPSVSCANGSCTAAAPAAPPARAASSSAHSRAWTSWRRKSTLGRAASPPFSHSRSASGACARVRPGEVPERLNGAVSKTVVPLRVPGVRIPPSPPVLLTFARLRLAARFACGLRARAASRSAVSLFG